VGSLAPRRGREVGGMGKINTIGEILPLAALLILYLILYLTVQVCIPETFYPRAINKGLIIQTNLSFDARELMEMIFSGEDRKVLVDGMIIEVRGRVEEISFGSSEALVRLGPPYKKMFGLVEIRKILIAFCNKNELIEKKVEIGCWVVVRGRYTVDRLIATNSGGSVFLVTLQDCHVQVVHCQIVP
jgi:hypothetical protein